MMVAGEEERNRTNVPLENHRYGTFHHPTAAPLPAAPLPCSPCNFQQQPQEGPAPFPGHVAVPVGYQLIPCAVVAEGVPVGVPPRLPCCGIGIGWAFNLDLVSCLESKIVEGVVFRIKMLVIMARFLLAAVPWYVGALILLTGALDYREKPGLVACTVAVSF
ncbi:60S ribosomal protein L18a-1 [Apostasia shenzhenica]|uniref:60S ribosomal protein L18a-1 n=1 Tax=Apostasia shenzhenica TaxID=1088818 RepID=A0A2H9ZTH4_9ASPA|nr:60S ribosomal protein L18a-1 [Apostasia shenzhenica]